jgi:hypothetical protein
MSRNLVREIAARYAHSLNFLLYGFGDEVSFRKPEPLLFTWIQEMTTTFREADPYRHITIVGEGKDWIGRGSDMVDLGGWYVPAKDLPDGLGTDIAAYVEAQIEPLRETRLAVWSSEGGLCEIGPALGRSSDQFLGPNGEMIHLHNEIWSSFMLGFCGAGSEWLSTQVAKFGQHYHHKAFAAYIAGEPLHELGLEPVKPRVSNERLRTFALKGDRKAFIWVQNRQNTWYKQIVEARGLQEVRGATLHLDKLSDGKWTVEWWDTYQGKVERTSTILVSNGSAELALPPILKDVAAKLRWDRAADTSSREKNP